MRQVLVPQSIPEKLTLEEALYWVTFRVYFTEDVNEYGKDFREFNEFAMDDIIPYENSKYDIDSFFNPQFCDEMGLPHSPLYEYLENYGEYPYFTQFSENQINKFEKEGTFSEDEIAEFRSDLEESLEYNKKKEIFDKAIDDYLEIFKAKLFIPIKNSNVCCYGRDILPLFLKQNSSTDYKNLLPEEILSKTIFDTEPQELEKIDKSIYRLDCIDWKKSTLKTDNECFIHILVDTESLFKEFPEPEKLKFQKITTFNTIFLVDENYKPIKAKPGRPSFKWKEFIEEMSIRFFEGNLPKQQKHCVLDMADWCIENWGQSPSETNLKEHISPFYQALKKVKK